LVYRYKLNDRENVAAASIFNAEEFLTFAPKLGISGPFEIVLSLSLACISVAFRLV
jgi:hypothetical protein